MSIRRILSVSLLATFVAISAYATTAPRAATTPLWLLTVRGDNTQIDFVFFTDAFATGFAALDPGFLFPSKGECQNAGRSIVASVLALPDFENNTYTINCALINPKDALIVDKNGVVRPKK